MADPSVVTVIVASPGSGKTTAALAEAAVLTAEGTVFYCAPTHELCGAAVAALPPTARSQAIHLRGFDTSCAVAGRAPKASRRRIAELARQLGRGAGPCGLEHPPGPRGRCAEAEHCTYAQTPPIDSIGGDRFVALTHARIAQLGARPSAPGRRPARLLLIDERMPINTIEQVTPADLRSWIKQGAWGAVAAALLDFGRQFPTQDRQGFAVHHFGHELLEGIRRALAAVPMPSSAPPNVRSLRLPSPARMRSDTPPEVPSTVAGDLLGAAASFCGGRQGSLEGWELVIAPAGDPVWERRTPVRLPAAVAVVAIDATGDITASHWRLLAAANGRGIKFVTLDLEGSPPRAALHYKTGALNAVEMWTLDPDGRPRLRDEAPGALRNALLGEMLPLLRRVAPGARQVAIIARKPVADSLRAGMGDAVAGAACALSPPVAREVAETMAALHASGLDVQIGHVGRDDRGTNRFAPGDDGCGGVDAIVALGNFMPNSGTHAADLRALSAAGVDATAGVHGATADSMAREAAVATLVQILGRGRHLRRSEKNRLTMIVCGPHLPVGAALGPVSWEVHEARVGAHAPTAADCQIRAVAEAVASEFRAISATMLKAHVGEWAARRIAGDVGAARDWTPHPVTTGRGRPKLVWAATASDALMAFQRFAAKADAAPQSEASAARTSDRPDILGSSDLTRALSAGVNQATSPLGDEPRIIDETDPEAVPTDDGGTPSGMSQEYSGAPSEADHRDGNQRKRTPGRWFRLDATFALDGAIRETGYAWAWPVILSTLRRSRCSGAATGSDLSDQHLFATAQAPHCPKPPAFNVRDAYVAVGLLVPAKRGRGWTTPDWKRICRAW